LQTTSRRSPTAINRDQQETPDLALLDVQMPELDGFGLAALVEDERTQQLRFVFTGDPDPYVEALAYEAGALGFIAKPFDPRDIGSFVNRALAHLAPRKSVAA
jgi:two-component system, NarL family, response regulator DesR